MRFGERLCIRIDVPASLGDARVPSFMLQPFVENALRHGLRQQSSAVRVDISASSDSNRLILRVEDDGAGLAKDWEERSASGFGIANTRARLQQLYGSSASLQIARRTDAKGTAVEVVLPYEREPAASGGAMSS
jgi:LytS/YehU family sensor histidine kinase